ncbi:MAG: ATP synthase F1 subunit epsilon [Actinobacteria bacterium]|nr:ATP synthase F1 subunit epsilon [Actinomycetota bacterium]
MANAFRLDVVSPEAVLWSGEAVFLITRTTEGEIGVLANHQPLMASLVPWSAAITPVDGPKVVLAVRGGFLQIVANRVTLLTDLAQVVEGEGSEAVEEARRQALLLAAALTDLGGAAGGSPGAVEGAGRLATVPNTEAD